MRKLFRDKQGVSAIEYCVLMALVAVALIFALTSVGASLANAFGGAEAGFSGGPDPDGTDDGDADDGDADGDSDGDG